MKGRFEFMKNIVWLTQLGISVVVPPALCILAAVWLRGRFGLGGWVVAVGVVVGLCAAFTALWSSLKAMNRSTKNGEDEGGVSFNEHK